MKRIVIACVFLCACNARVWSEPIYTMERIGRAAGLPQSSVRAIAIDKFGFLWVGTETGVARYDGYRFKTIAPPFGSGVAMSIHADSHHRLWIRWYGKPLTLYDTQRDTWQVMDGVDSVDTFDGFLQDPSGVVWLSRKDALLYYDETSRHLVKAADLAPDPDGLYFPQLAFFRGAVWITAHKEVVAVDVRTRQVSRIATDAPYAPPHAVVTRLRTHQDSLWLCNPSGLFRLADDAAHFIAEYRDANRRISACEFGADGAIWIGTRDAGVVRINNGKEQRSRRRLDDLTSLADNHVLNIQTDRRGQVWAMTPGVAHRWIGDERDDRWERFTHSPDSRTDNPGAMAAYRLLEDRSGVLWLGSENAGLVRISRYAHKARWLAPPSNISKHVRTPVVDGHGNIWIGMNQDGVFRFDPHRAAWTHFAADENDPTRLPRPEVRAVVAARDGGIWAGSNSGGVISRYDETSGRWRRFKLGNPAQIVFTFLEHPNGKLIVGRQSSADEFDPATLRVSNYPTPNNAPIRASTASRTGNVFFGTHLEGVLEFIPGRGFARQWRDELSDTNVFSIHEDRFGSVWIGTWGGGLNRLDPASGKMQVIKTGDGLPDDTIFGIEPGRHDDLWVSTNSGLARIEHCVTADWPCRPAITVLDTANGLPFSEFDAEAAGRAPNGDLLFGGIDGLLMFDPDGIERNPHAPVLRLASMSLNDRTIAPSSSESARALELGHAFGTLKLEFSALDFHASRNNRYRYRLQPGGEWLSLGAEPSIVLNNLGAGRHTVEVIGSNNDGVWSESPLMLAVRVSPPWYSSSLAWLGYGLFALVAVLVLVKWRERRLQANTVRLETLVAERTAELAAANQARDEFYANVSHEIRTPLTLLIGAAEELKNHGIGNEQAALANDLIRHSDSLRRYVESLITVSHLHSATAVSWLQEDVGAYLRNTLADFRRIAGETVLRLNVPDVACHVRSYPNALDTIFPNLLMNALRHTPKGGEVAVTVIASAESFAIEVADSGAGIDSQLLPSLFERGMRGTSSASIGGYGIGLNLVKQTVAALGGRIEARNRSEGGASFVVTLPHADATLPIASYARTPLPFASQAPIERGSTRAAVQKQRASLLIVEDHDELRSQLVALFAACYRVREAASVAAGIAIAKAHLPDAVICDVMLPDGSGFDVVSALKSNSITDHIGVILLTALADEGSRLRGLSDRADLYVTKPFRREEFALQVDNLVEQRRRIRRAAARELWTIKATSTSTAVRSQETFESRLLAAIGATYADPDAGVDAIAQRMAMSRKQLERKTRYCFKCSPKALLNRYRLDKAQLLLADGARVAEAAERCGFASQSHFGALFKKRFGHAPSKQSAQATEVWVEG